MDHSVLRRRPVLPLVSTLTYTASGKVHTRHVNLKASKSTRIAAVAHLCSRERVSYSEALSLVGGVKGRALEAADLGVPMRALRYWAINGAGGDIKHVFHPDHLYIIARIVSMVYGQEYNEDNNDPAFLRIKELFGEDAEEQDCSLYVLYDMWRLARDNLDGKRRQMYSEHTEKDDDDKRLKQLTRKYRAAVSEEGNSWEVINYADQEAVFHVLPLDSDGRVKALATTDTVYTARKLAAYDPFPHDAMVYMRGKTVVEVSINGHSFSVKEHALSDDFWESYDHLEMSFKGNEETEYDWSEDERSGGINTLIRDANAGNVYAGAYLLSQTLQGRVFTSGGAFPFVTEGYDSVEEHLKMRVLCKLLGEPLLIKYGDYIVLPVRASVGEGQWGYLVQRDWNAYEVDWRSAPEEDEEIEAERAEVYADAQLFSVYE